MAIELLMSSCLIGQCCRWDAKMGKSCVTPTLHLMLNNGRVAVICPECAGGLDVTAQYVSGAKAALALVQKHGIRVAILKSRSPSCGRDQVYDGTFAGKLIEGRGVTAELLMQHGVKVFDETHIDEALACLEELRKTPAQA